MFFWGDLNNRYDFGVSPLIFLPKCYKLVRRVTYFEHREHILRVPYGQLLMFSEI